MLGEKENQEKTVSSLKNEILDLTSNVKNLVSRIEVKSPSNG
jgi:archaellum component FlaC